MAKKKKAAKKKSGGAKGAKSYIAKAPIRRLMKAEGAELVANEAVQLLIDKLVNVAATVTKDAVKLVKADKRKRVTASDIMDATR